MTRNLRLISRALFRANLVIFAVSAVVLGLLMRPWDLLSMGLGQLFSYILVVQMMASQSAIVIRRKKSLFFMAYLKRLFLVAIPVGMGLVLKDYLTFSIILVCLFSNQAIYIGFEFCRSYRKVKRKQWTS
tara:strand:+ start:269 stop:658 length:390 start_codon:yes stop_codon:yes gene_type:complete